MIKKKIICIIMLVSIFTGCETGKNNYVNKVELDENQTKVSQENQSNESKNNETKQKGKTTENKKNNQVEKIENEIDLSEIDLSGEDKASGIKVGGYLQTNKSWNFGYKKFNGIGTIRKFKCNEDSEIEFEYSSETSEGNINVIILDEDYNILKKFGANESKTFTLNVIKDKVYSIRIIGDNAEDGKTSIKILNPDLKVEAVE
ncbi:hypothetical protein [Oceanirhabdus seepicola]|uniref:Lipoprotein n=1 Tax=Oceanirhabdus seepicola TaxID=2828781 RepID=A0A9J6P9X9_9CLOT|nr:hypothetical protein [Oceanirhabdus seepicola]MCM1992096.1 hypothetical protein [Oceanirhabdus seepicola]